MKDLEHRQNLLLEYLAKYEQIQEDLKKHFSFDSKAIAAMSDGMMDALHERTESLKEAENKVAKDIALLLVYMAKETDQVKIKKAS